MQHINNMHINYVCIRGRIHMHKGFRARPEEYLFERFGGGNYKLNFYEGPSFVVCVNFKPKGEPKWVNLLPEKAGTNPIPA